MSDHTAISWCDATPRRSAQSRERNHQWKGGRVVASNGYVLVKVGFDHHLADVRGYAYEHRLVAERKIGRRLIRGEIVHHVDGNKQNNADDNINVMPSRAHHHVEHRQQGSRLRRVDEPNSRIACACGCGSLFDRFDSQRRPRRFVGGHNLRGPHG